MLKNASLRQKLMETKKKIIEQKDLEKENREKEELKNEIMLLKQEIKQLKEQNEAQTRALLESNKLMEEIIAMQKTFFCCNSILCIKSKMNGFMR